MIILSWISNPYHPDTTLLYQKITEMLNSSLVESLDNGFVKITASINDNLLTSQLLDTISKVRLLPVYLACSKKDIADVDILGLKTIVQNLVTILLQVNVDSVEIIDYRSAKLFFPIASDGNQFYRSANEIAWLNTNINLNSMIGYQYLTDNPLVYLSSKRLNINLQSIDIIYLTNCLLISTNERETKQLLTDDIENLKRDGYYSLPSSFNDQSLLDDDHYWYQAIATRFNLSYQSIDRYAYIRREQVNQIEINRSVSNKLSRWSIAYPDKWLKESVNRVKGNKFPLVNVQAPTGNSLIFKQWYLKTYYQSMLAYRDLINKQPFLSSNYPQVYQDLSISLPVTSSTDVDQFLNFFDYYNKYSEQWYILALSNDMTLESLIDGLVYRWYFLTTYNSTNPLLLPIDNQLYIIVDIDDKSKIKIPDLTLVKKQLVNILQDEFKTKETDLVNLVNMLSSNDKQLALYGIYPIGPFRGLFNYSLVQQSVIEFF